MSRCLSAIDAGMGVNAASRTFGIPKPSIRRHRLGLNKYAVGSVKFRGGPCVLPDDVENELVEHIKKLDEAFFGISIMDLRKLAYQVACAHGIKKFSDTHQAANKTWFYNFMKRHPELSLRSPEPTSIGRQRGFNRQDVGDFFDKYCKLIEEEGFAPSAIYNMDETGHSTVQTPTRVISVKGKRQVGATTSAERGTNTTGVHCHSATGHFIPPMLIFKRKRMADSLKVDAPNGTVFACTDSGWIDTDIFIQWLRHFIQSVNASPENKVLLLLDGHTSHSKNLDAINLARENGVFILSFPAHTTHRLQPLDVAFFKPLKNWYNIEIENFLKSSQGKAVGVHLVSRLVGRAFIKAATMETAINGFRKTGLWPPNPHIFDDEFRRMEAIVDSHPTTTRVPEWNPQATDHPNEAHDATTGLPPEPSTASHGAGEIPTESRESTAAEESTSPSESTAAPELTGFQSLPTKGDGRCFFRAVVISLNPDLQKGERNHLTGELLDPMKSIQETARADNLRTTVITHMCEHLDAEPGAAVLSADMPARIQFHSVAERILHMSDQKSMVGELEIQATAKVLDRPVHVVMVGTDHISKYNASDNCTNDPVIVKYIPHADAGHYEAMVRLAAPRIIDLSPIPRVVGGSKRKTPESSKSHLFTSSPYKNNLEQKKKCAKPSSRKTDKSSKQPGRKKQRAKAKRVEPSDSSSDDDDPFCIVCCEKFSCSRSREKWIACVSCKKWAHVQCTPDDGHPYVCHHCDSDDD